MTAEKNVCRSLSINQSVFISGKVPIETNNKQTDRQTVRQTH